MQAPSICLASSFLSSSVLPEIYLKYNAVDLNTGQSKTGFIWKWNKSADFLGFGETFLLTLILVWSLKSQRLITALNLDGGWGRDVIFNVHLNKPFSLETIWTIAGWPNNMFSSFLWSSIIELSWDETLFQDMPKFYKAQCLSLTQVQKFLWSRKQIQIFV